MALERIKRNLFKALNTCLGVSTCERHVLNEICDDPEDACGMSSTIFSLI
jgi:hypothetical protein